MNMKVIILAVALLAVAYALPGESDKSGSGDSSPPITTPKPGSLKQHVNKVLSKLRGAYHLIKNYLSGKSKAGSSKNNEAPSAENNGSSAKNKGSSEKNQESNGKN